MFVMVSPVQKYKLVKTEQRLVLPPATAPCVPSRSRLLMEAALREKGQQVDAEGYVWESQPDGPPKGIRLSVVHSRADCIHINRKDQAAEAVLVEVGPQELGGMLMRHLSCCKHCFGRIMAETRSEEPLEVEAELEPATVQFGLKVAP